MVVGSSGIFDTVWVNEFGHNYVDTLTIWLKMYLYGHLACL